MSPIAYAIPVFFGLIALEMLISHRRRLGLYRFQDTITSLNVGLVSQFVNTIGGVISVAMYAFIVNQYGAFTWDTSHPMTWVLALLLYDFFYYWVHRCGHEINILWAAHVVHHSSEEFNLSTALRQSSTGFYFRWVFYIPLALLGIPVKVFIVVGLIDLLYQYWVHTQLVGRLGVLERFMVTPSNHRVHHGQNDYCIDKNYGGIFSIWDRMFGTYAEEREEEKIIYGVRKPLQSWNPVWANLHHYADIFRQIKTTPGWRYKFMCVFAGPGWQPPNSPDTSNFSPNLFQRFSSPAPHFMRFIGIFSTAISVVLLIHFLMMQSTFSFQSRIVYAGVMVLFLMLVGYAWLHPKIVKYKP